MVDVTEYDPILDKDNTAKLYKILCGAINRRYDNLNERNFVSIAFISHFENNC
jgi:hypothetical protein